MSNINFGLMRKTCHVLFAFILVCCQKKESKPVEEFLKTSDLYSKVYYISPRLNTEQCIADNEGCDCCDGKIVFLENGTFVSDFYCIPTESFNTGTYKVQDKKVVLNYAKTEALLGPEDETDYEAESVLRLDTIAYGTVSLDIIKCRNKYIFKGESDYFGENNKIPFRIAINQYKRNGVWKLLNLKE